MDIHVNPIYGKLNVGTVIELPNTGFVVLAGPNNRGKSTVLQFLFKTLHGNEEYGESRTALFLPERAHVAASFQPTDRTLEHFNRDLMLYLSTEPLSYEDRKGPNQNELMRLLLNHTDTFNQVEVLNEHLYFLGFDKFGIRGAQQIHISDSLLINQGTGLRSVLGILSALTDSNLKAILIDEPEASLEPLVQKRLRDLLIEKSKDKLIVVATHSHLLLNRKDPTANRIVGRDQDGWITVDPISDISGLLDLTFNLLGNDTQDLFFPHNYLIVEGASEEKICNKVLSLLAVPNGRVKVLAAGGLTRVASRLSAVEDSLIPLVVADSPYKSRVVTLIDKPKDSDKVMTANLQKELKERCFTLESTSLEEHLPDEVYESAGLNKKQVIKDLGEANGNYERISKIKGDTSNMIANAMTEEHLKLDEMMIFVQAIEKANK